MFPGYSRCFNLYGFGKLNSYSFHARQLTDTVFECVWDQNKPLGYTENISESTPKMLSWRLLTCYNDTSHWSDKLWVYCAGTTTKMEIDSLCQLKWKLSLTLALASTCAPLRSKMRMMSVWLARAAKCSGVSPRTVGTSGLASFCSR